MFCHVAKSHNNKLSIKKSFFFPFQVHVNLVCLSTRDRSYNCDSLLAGLSLFDRMSSKVLHSHCDSDEKVVPGEPATLASSLHECSVFLLGDYVHVSSLLILSSAFSLNALCHLCTVHCLPSPMAHDTARGAPELCRTPGYPITGLKGKRLNPFQSLVSKKRRRIPYDWFMDLHSLLGSLQAKDAFALGSDGKKGAAHQCTSVCESELLPSERSISDLSTPVQLRETKSDLISF